MLHLFNPGIDEDNKPLGNDPVPAAFLVNVVFLFILATATSCNDDKSINPSVHRIHFTPCKFKQLSVLNKERSGYALTF